MIAEGLQMECAPLF